ncbi:hypothetical protein P1S61_37550 [Streptomyces sp. ME08-AFT2]|jgi:hypothetical protein|uniref:hypothetical protein n=1 Tax=unclassified Streptomyces TaxID=2593676 RepID=UPI0029AA8FF0|nr:hypothetical protein [Streptomyces sp. ME08-AFT2]MDX3314663.1 hypothetical protein [Streptomyces sp. ME08-AFT2]
MRRTTAIACLLLAATVAGCSSGTDKPTPTPTPTAAATSSAPVETPAADLIAACTDAIAAGKDTGDGAPECTGLPVDDYMKALEAANKRGRDALESAIASAGAQ